MRPFEEYIPQSYRENPTDALTALTAKADRHLEEWQQEILGMGAWRRPDQIPSALLEELGYWLAAGFKPGEPEQSKRINVAVAVQTHKRRGSFKYDAKPKIDAIAGGDSVIIAYSLDYDDWIMYGSAYNPAGNQAIFGTDGIDLTVGIGLTGKGTEPEIAGNIYIDVDNAALTPDQVIQLVLALDTDVCPAYMKVHLGYVDGLGYHDYVIIG